MIEIEVQEGTYIVKARKRILVLTRAQLIEALKRGKAYRRQQQRSARVAPIDGNNRGFYDARLENRRL